MGEERQQSRDWGVTGEKAAIASQERIVLDILTARRRRGLPPPPLRCFGIIDDAAQARRDAAFGIAREFEHIGHIIRDLHSRAAGSGAPLPHQTLDFLALTSSHFETAAAQIEGHALDATTPLGAA